MNEMSLCTCLVNCCSPPVTDRMFPTLSPELPNAFARRQGGGRAPVEDGGRSVPAAGGVQRPAGGRAGGPAPAGTHAHRVHPEPEGCPDREGEEAGSEYW